MPHSTLLKPVQRPARSFSPSAIRRVQGWQPMEAVSLILQGVVGNLVFVQVIPHSLTGPIRHGIEFHDVASSGLVERIDFKDADAGTGIRLLAAQASNPAVELGKLVAKRKDLRIVQQRSGLCFQSSGPLMSPALQP